MDSNWRVTSLPVASPFSSLYQAPSTYRFWRAVFYSRIFATIRATRPSRLSKFSCVGNTGFDLLLTLRTYKLTVVAKVRSVRLLYSHSLCVVPNTIVAGHVSKPSHCRFHASFEGFEWFIYNRTAAFDNIVSQMEATTPVPESRAQGSSADRAASQLRHIFTRSPAGSDSACILFCRYSRVIVHHTSQTMCRLLTCEILLPLPSFCAASSNGSEVNFLILTPRTYFLSALSASMVESCAVTWQLPTS